MTGAGSVHLHLAAHPHFAWVGCCTHGSFPHRRRRFSTRGWPNRRHLVESPRRLGRALSLVHTGGIATCAAVVPENTAGVVLRIAREVRS